MKEIVKNIAINILNIAKGCSKALFGALAAALVAYLSKRGMQVPEGFEDAIVTLGAALVGFGIVYLSPKNKE